MVKCKIVVILIFLNIMAPCYANPVPEAKADPRDILIQVKQIVGKGHQEPSPVPEVTTTTPAINSINEFKSFFNKTYENEEEEKKRTEIFQNNVKAIENHNKLYKSGKSSYQMGVNEYSDMTYDEVVSEMTGAIEPNQSHRVKRQSGYLYNPTYMGDEPESKDYRYILNPIRNQGQCGSCWAFSTTSSIESQIILKKGELLQLSEQDLVDCSKPYGPLGCKGGWCDWAIQYVMEKGIAFRDEYLYTGKDGTCWVGAPKIWYKVTGMIYVRHNSDTELLNALVHMGPVNIYMYVSPNFQSYKGGVFVDDLCTSDKNVNHAMLLVGYGTEHGKDYWLIRNSWGETWGEEGYLKLSRNEWNHCNIYEHGGVIPVIGDEDYIWPWGTMDDAISPPGSTTDDYYTWPWSTLEDPISPPGYTTDYYTWPWGTMDDAISPPGSTTDDYDYNFEDTTYDYNFEVTTGIIGGGMDPGCGGVTGCDHGSCDDVNCPPGTEEDYMCYCYYGGMCCINNTIDY